MEGETHFCRLCLTTSVVYYSLLKNNGKEMVFSLTKIQVSEDDPYSTESCAKCWLDLKYAYYIQQCFIETGKKFEQSTRYTDTKFDINEIKVEVKSTDVVLENEKIYVKEENEYDELEIEITECYQREFSKHEQIENNECDQLENNECDQLENNESDQLENNEPDQLEDSQCIQIEENKNDSLEENICDSLKDDECDQMEENEIIQQDENDDTEYHELIYIQTDEVDEGNPCACFICGIACKDEPELYSHINTHYNRVQQCGECSEQLPNIPVYRKHLQLKHPKLLDQTYVCDICSVSFKYISLYNIHLDAVHPKRANRSKRKRKLDHNKPDVDDSIETIYKCDECDKSFSNKKTLDGHIINHVKKSCPICGMKITRLNLTKHIRSHEAEPVICDLCGVTCKHRESLRWHKYYKHSGKKIICKECGQVFNRPYPYKVHLQKHAGDRGFTCDSCGKGFFTQHRLNIHINTAHLKIRPHICKFCGKALAKREAMLIHERKHTKEEPYVCDVCGDGFRQNISLRTHRKSKHNIIELKNVQCPICDKMFKDSWALQSHTRSQHD